MCKFPFLPISWNDVAKSYRIYDKMFHHCKFYFEKHKIHVHKQATILIEHSCQINQLDTALIIYVIFFFFFNTSRSDFVAFRLISYLQIKKKSICLM